MLQKLNFTVLISPLDWGLGHASRCVPLIKFLLLLGCKVIIATDGTPEKLLKTEFPSLLFVHLPGYKINYSKYKRLFSINIILQLPKILLAIRKEKKWLKKFILDNEVNAIISDNRYGFCHLQVPSVIITHQLTIKTPFAFAERILQKINYRFLKHFSTCWVPDEEGAVNLAGNLSHPVFFPPLPVHYIGGVSRLEKRQQMPKIYDVLIILSGPEPQRTILEKKILAQTLLFEGKILLVRGLPGNSMQIKAEKNMTIKSHLSAGEMENAFSSSEYIISRSGYTTVMDICKLQKKSILIPTPGQTEQEYLAIHLQKQGWCFSVSQKDFLFVETLKEAKNFQYQFPDLNMETYKNVVSSFISSLTTPTGNAKSKD